MSFFDNYQIQQSKNLNKENNSNDEMQQINTIPHNRCLNSNMNSIKRRNLCQQGQILQQKINSVFEKIQVKIECDCLSSDDSSTVNRLMTSQEGYIVMCDPKNEINKEQNPQNMNYTKKQEFILRIKDTSSQYWKKLTEEDDNYLLSLYENIDKNNINKNILSSFLKYIYDKGDNIVLECLDSKSKELKTIRKELKNFTRNKNLNNNTINSFFNSSRYAEQFEYFLKFYAIDYFSQSKVKDKNSHYICIAFFLRCFSSSKLREKMVVYNKSKYFKSLHSNRFTKK
ncbi:hypothetical protein ABPG72_004961 [Tetrahymena utriculariae]